MCGSDIFSRFSENKCPIVCAVLCCCQVMNTALMRVLSIVEGSVLRSIVQNRRNRNCCFLGVKLSTQACMFALLRHISSRWACRRSAYWLRNLHV
jgi:hypothetical protein